MPYSRTQMGHSPTKMQVWIDRMRFVLGVVTIIAIAVTFVLGQQENQEQNARLQKVESPCLRYGPRSKACRQSFNAALKSLTPAQACYIARLRQESETPLCARIAVREAKRRQAGERSTPGSPAGSSPAPGASTPPGSHSAPPGDVGSQSPGSGHHHGSPSPGQPGPSPQQPGSPSSPGPDSSTAPPSQPRPPAASEGPAPSPAQESPSAPPIVAVEVPVLPAHACVSGVLNVNC